MSRKILIYLLMIDALLVFILQLLRVNAWAFICLYWLILTVKNTMDANEAGNITYGGTND